MQNNAAQSNAKKCKAMRSHKVQNYAIQCNATQCKAMQTDKKTRYKQVKDKLQAMLARVMARPESNPNQCKAMQSSAMPSDTKQMLCQAMSSKTTQCEAVQSNANPCKAVQSNVTQCERSSSQGTAVWSALYSDVYIYTHTHTYAHIQHIQVILHTISCFHGTLHDFPQSFRVLPINSYLRKTGVWKTGVSKFDII